MALFCAALQHTKQSTWHSHGTHVKSIPMCAIIQKCHSNLVSHSVLHNRVNVLEYLMTQLTSDMIEQDIDKSQNTPLHWAADKGFLICCKVRGWILFP